MHPPSPLMRNIRALAAVCLSFAGFAFISSSVCAQSVIQIPMPQNSNILNFQSAAQVEVVQDILRIHLGTSTEGNEANAVQKELQKALDIAVREAKKTAEKGRMEIRTGHFQLHPRHDHRSGKINGWSGSTELILEGDDFARITAAAEAITTLNITHLGFGLSKTARENAEAQAQTEAVASFTRRAKDLSRSFGFADYTLREVSINGNEMGGGQPEHRMMAMKMASDASESVAAEPGKTIVQVSVNGSIQMK